MGNYSTKRYQTIVDAGAGGGGGAEPYATINDLPATADTGALAYVTGNNSIYMWKGSVWFKIVSAESPNLDPFFTSQPRASYALPTDGSPLVLNFAVTDPEGAALTWNYAITSGTLGSTATISNDGNGQFTITPSTTTADQGTFGVTFSATDGTNIAYSNPVRLTLLFSLSWTTATLQHTIVNDVNSTQDFGCSTGVSNNYLAVGDKNEPANGKTKVGKLYIYDIADVTSPSIVFEWTPYAIGDDDVDLQFGDKVLIHDNVCFVKGATNGSAGQSTYIWVFKRTGTTWAYDHKFDHRGLNGPRGVNETAHYNFEYDPVENRVMTSHGATVSFFHYDTNTNQYVAHSEQVSAVSGTQYHVHLNGDYAASTNTGGDDISLYYLDPSLDQWVYVSTTVLNDCGPVYVAKWPDGTYTVISGRMVSYRTLHSFPIDTANKQFGTQHPSQTAANGYYWTYHAGTTPSSFGGAGSHNRAAFYQDDTTVYVLGGNSAVSDAIVYTSVDKNGNFNLAADITWPAHNPDSWGWNVAWDPITGVFVTGSINEQRVYIYRI